MNNLVIPPSPNWYESKILACTADNTIIYGAKTEIVVIEPQTYDKPADINIIPHAHFERVTSIDVNLDWGVGNKWAVSAGEDKIVKLWNLEDYTNKCSNITHTAYTEKLIGAVFAGNDKVIAASENGLISIWRVLTDEVTSLKNLFTYKVHITTLSACPHSSWLIAFGLKCGLVIIADIRKNGKILYKMRGHDKSVVSLSWCPIPSNIFPESTIRKRTVKKDYSNEKEKENKADNQDKNAPVDKILSNQKVNENQSVDISASTVCTIETIDLKDENLACDTINIIENVKEENIVYKNETAESINSEQSTECDSKETKKTEILPLDKDSNTCNDNLSNSSNDANSNSNKEIENNEPIDIDSKICDDLNNGCKGDSDNILDDKGTQNNEVCADVNVKNDDNHSISNTNKELETNEALSADTGTKNVDGLDNSIKANSDNILDSKESEGNENNEVSADGDSKTNDINTVLNTNTDVEKSESLSVDGNRKTCDDLDNCNKANLESRRTENNENNMKVDVEDSEVSDIAVIQNKEGDDSNIICETHDIKQLKKEFLLASSSRGGSIFIWRAGTDGRKQIELYLSSNRNKRKYRSNDKNWITLCWIAPHILLSSSSFGELLQWDFSKVDKEMGTPQKKLVHHDHGNNLFAIAAPIKLGGEIRNDDWRNRSELFAWSFGQERFLLCTSLQADRTTHVSYPTNGGYIYCLASSPLDPNRLAIGIGDNTAKIWDLSRPHLQCVLMSNLWQKIQSKVLALAWHPTKEAILAYATFEGRIGLINSNNTSKAPILLNQYFRTVVHKIAWGPLNGNIDSMGLYACGEGGLAAYNVEKPTDEPKIIQVGTKEHVTSMCWKPDYSLFSVGTKAGSIFIYNLNLDLVTTIYGQHKSILNILWHPEATAEDNEISPYSSWFAVSTTDASILVFDVSKEKGSGDEEKEDPRLSIVLNGHSKPVRSLCWSSYEGAKLISGGDDGVAQVWDVTNGNIISTFTGHNVEAILAVLWSPLDKNFVITGGKDNCIRIWNIKQHKPMTETELAEVRKERLKLKQSLKKYKQADESDEDEGSAKVKRSAMLSLTARSQNNTVTVLEDCKLMFHMRCGGNMEDLIKPKNGVNHFDTTQLFGDKDNVVDLLEAEQEKHVGSKKLLSSQYISLWKGDIAETLKEAIKNQTVNPWLISMAPMVSPKLWQEACDVYATQLMENTKADPLETVSYLLACHKVEEAVNVLCSATLFREALALAKCRLSKTDPIINDILSKWATFSVLHGAYEVAAQCFIALEQYEEATKALFKRSDEKTLEFAVQLANTSGNQDLKDAIMFRYNSFKNSCVDNQNESKIEKLASENDDETQLKSDQAFVEDEESIENASNGCNHDG